MSSKIVFVLVAAALGFYDIYHMKGKDRAREIIAYCLLTFVAISLCLYYYSGVKMHKVLFTDALDKAVKAFKSK